MEEEKVRKIAELRERLEERTKSLEAELEGMRTLLDVINELLIEKSFKRAEEIARPATPRPPKVEPQPAPPKKPVKTFALKTKSGVLLANLYVEDDSMRIVPHLKFNVNAPPFTAFLVEKILANMRQRDLELARQGQIKPEKVLSFEIEKDADILQAVIIHNFAPERERELRSATRWTLEKMHEKMKSSS